MTKPDSLSPTAVIADAGECTKCENFGTSTCPTFKMAVAAGVDPDELARQITEAQHGIELSSCENDPGGSAQTSDPE